MAVKAKLTISIEENGQLNWELPADHGVALLLISAAHEIVMRQFIPQQPATKPDIVIPDILFGGGKRL